jgi:Family of unknown function (DUF6353)
VWIQKIGKLLIDNSPTILTAVGVTGTVGTAVLTGRATFKAAEILEAETNELETRDKLNLVWKCYIPPVAVGAITVVCIIGANRIGMRRAAALAAAYSLAEKAFDEYRAKVHEHLGSQKEQRIRDDIAQDRVIANPVSTREVFITGNGEVLCYDSITGRYFQSNVESLRKAQNDINHAIIHDLYASLSDFYNKIGIPTTSYSNEVGWNLDDMLEIDFSAVIAEDGRPCICIDYKFSPVRGYSRLQ